MNRELIKSIALTVLVVLSLCLTWSIWTYQGNYSAADTEKTLEVVPIDPENDFSLEDVVKPNQLIHFSKSDEGDVSGTISKEYVEPVFSRIIKAKWTADSIGNNNPPKAVSDSYELLFPAPVTINTLQALFNLKTNDAPLPQNKLIDRFVVYRYMPKATAIVFKDSDEDTVFYATTTELDMENIEDEIGKGHFKRYFAVKLRNKRVYLPEEPVRFQRLVYPYKLINLEAFKPILFANPDKTDYYSDKLTFSDGISQLKQEGNVLKFFNPATNGEAAIRDPIIRSFQKVSSHKGWTDSFIYDQFTSNPAEGEENVEFRLVRNDLPVYSRTDPYESVIAFTWENGSLYKLNRTLINVGSNPYSNEKSDPLPSGRSVLDMLEQAHLPLQNLDDLQLGYVMDVDEDQRLVTYTPDWFIKKGDDWESLTSYLNRQKATVSPSEEGKR